MVNQRNQGKPYGSHASCTDASPVHRVVVCHNGVVSPVDVNHGHHETSWQSWCTIATGAMVDDIPNGLMLHLTGLDVHFWSMVMQSDGLIVHWWHQQPCVVIVISVATFLSEDGFRYLQEEVCILEQVILLVVAWATLAAMRSIVGNYNSVVVMSTIKRRNICGSGGCSVAMCGHGRCSRLTRTHCCVALIRVKQ